MVDSLCDSCVFRLTNFGKLNAFNRTTIKWQLMKVLSSSRIKLDYLLRVKLKITSSLNGIHSLICLWISGRKISKDCYLNDDDNNDNDCKNYVFVHFRQKFRDQSYMKAGNYHSKIYCIDDKIIIRAAHTVCQACGWCMIHLLLNLLRIFDEKLKTRNIVRLKKKKWKVHGEKKYQVDVNYWKYVLKTRLIHMESTIFKAQQQQLF